MGYGYEVHMFEESGAQPHVRLERIAPEIIAGLGSGTPEVRLDTFDLGIMER